MGVSGPPRAALGVDAVVPFVAVTVAGLRVGHSAHVSRTGFIAATGFRSSTAKSATFASWLDEEQLACLDASEPNYVRQPLDLPATLDSGRPASDLWVYDSIWGVLGHPDDGPPGRRRPAPRGDAERLGRPRLEPREQTGADGGD